MPTPAPLPISPRGPRSAPSGVHTPSRLRMCTAQEDIPADDDSPSLPAHLLNERRHTRRSHPRLTVQEALHGALGSDEPVELLHRSSKGFVPHCLPMDCDEKPSEDNGGGQEQVPERLLSLAESGHRKSPGNEAEVETRLSSESEPEKS